MRPLCLTMEAFGPYADRQVLDFAGELKDRSFFLIHGPTGAGKTTILDAVCFALYGDASGTLRDSKTLRSHYADSSAETCVVFDFAVGSRHYRIRRLPEQERRKKRGEGTTAMPAEAQMWELAPDRHAELIASGWSRVTEAVENLLGFKSSQFRQVVLLPQGDFRRLLTANSAERQEIMQTLFKTELYRQIEERLKAKAAEVKKEYEDLNRRKAWVLAEAKAKDDDELKQRRLEHLEQAKECSGRLKELAEKLKQAQTAVEQGRLVEQKITDMEQAGLKLEELTSKLSVVEEKKLELKNGQAAAKLIDAEKLAVSLAREVQRLDSECKRLKTELAQAERKLAEADKLLTDEKARDAERDRAAQEILRLNELEGKVELLAEAVQKADDALRDARQAEREYGELAKQVESAECLHKQMQEKLDKLLELAALSPGRKAEFELWERRIDACKKLSSARRKLKTAQAAANKAADGLRQAEDKYKQAKDKLAVLQQAWFSGQAAVMAARLLPGEPCPVCGSHEHPKPAAAAGVIPGQNEVEAQQRLVEELDVERAASRDKLSRLENECIQLKTEVSYLEQDLGPYKDSSLDELAAGYTQAEAVCKEAAEAEREAGSVKRRMEQAKNELNNLGERLKQAEQARAKRQADYKAALAVVEERRQAVPQELADKPALAKAKQAAVLLQQKLKAALEKAQTAKQNAQNMLTEAKAKLESGLKVLDDTRQRADQARRDFEQRLKGAGFNDAAQYQAAKKSEEYIDKLEERIKQFEQDLAAKRETYRLAKEAAKDLVRPDMAALERLAAEAQVAYNEALVAVTELNGKLEQEKAWLDELERLAEETDKVEERYSVVVRMAEVANGTNAQRLTFQRFVLSALLEQVASAANQRLKIMTRGRFLLQRTLDRARKNAAGGLDLEVVDNYTGIARPVGTLSGGETFLASLSLALGLADVVQRYAGGLYLDTILVDEGFGTLDPETLDIAIKALIDLQRDGRLVGIISHVPELKERIDARLEVIPAERGSRACFRVS